MNTVKSQLNKVILLAVLCTGVFGFASAVSAFTCTAVAGGGNWSSASTWSGCNSTIPQTGDDVVLNASSGNVVVDAASNSINSLNMTGYTGTLSGSQNITQLTLTNGTSVNVVIAGNITWTGALILDSLSSATTTLTTNGKTLTNVSFGTLGSGSTGVYVIADNLTVSSAGTVTLTRGTLHADGPNDNSGLTHSWGKFSSANSNVRALYLGNSTINVTNGSATIWDTGSNSTNLTINAGTSNIILALANTTFFSSTFAFNNVTFNSYGQILSAGNSTFNTVTFNDTTIDFEYLRSSITATNFIFNGTTNGLRGLDISNDFTVTGSIQLNGNSSTNRILVRSGTLGTQHTITNTGATITASNVDFRDIAFSSPVNLSNIPGGSGDALGNSGITFTPSQTNYWVGNTGNWSDSTHWASTSGGVGGTGRVPLPQDDEIFDGSFVSNAAITMDMLRLGRTITWSGTFSGTKTRLVNNVTNNEIYGSLINNGNVSWFASSPSLTFLGRGSFVLRSGGASFGNNPVAFSMVGGTMTLQDSFTPNNPFQLNNGTFNDGGFSVTSTGFSSAGSATRALNMSGIWTMTGTSGNGNQWNANSSLTLNSAGSTIIISNTSSGTKNVSMGGLTYNNFSITGGGSGVVNITGANTFNKFTIGAPKTVIFPSSTTNTFTQFIAKGTSGNLITVQSSTPGTKYTLKQTSGFVSSDWMSITDSTATGGAGWFAGTNSTLSNSTGWQLLRGPVQRGVIFQNAKIKIQKGKVKFQFR